MHRQLLEEYDEHASHDCGSLSRLAVAALLVARSPTASAQTYPNQRVTIVVPFTAGSITDGLARILADKLGELWKQQVIVENRPGTPGNDRRRQELRPTATR